MKNSILKRLVEQPCDVTFVMRTLPIKGLKARGIGVYHWVMAVLKITGDAVIVRSGSVKTQNGIVVITPVANR